MSKYRTATSVKDYLSQAYRIDIRITSKLEQLMSLRSLATRANATLDDAPHSSTRNLQSMEDTIIKMIDLERNINADIDALVELKYDIMLLIRSMENSEWHTLLEMRYLCFKPWEQIAATMGCDPRSVFRLHQKALEYIAEKKLIPCQ